ncbi:unnamed protein product [Urochloa decumbens]|uniref:BHLH domain-containing protein n=1 Tax=Urochloa decumbens TaxID=240449 RepID=A0ABC9CTX3_9POAL
MAQQDAPAHEDPVGRGRSSTPPATGGMWESPPRQMQPPHAPFPSWSPYAGTFATALGDHLSPAAADSRLPSERVPDHAWNNQSAPIMAAHGGSGSNFLSLLEARNVTPEMFEDVAGAAAYGVGGSVDPYSAASVPQARHGTASSPLVYSVGSVVHGGKVDSAACYEHGVKGGNGQQQEFGAPAAAVLQKMIPSRVEIQSAPGYSGMWSERERLGESSFGVLSLPDAGSFGDYRSAAEFVPGRDNNRHEQDIRPGMGSSSSGSGVASAGAAVRKSEGRVRGNPKRSKQEVSRKASPPKAQAPKVKLGEKITALQQIVSPFGKTDTSSVLFETIKYIEFLHEQLRLFSEPYVAKGAYEGHIQLGGGDEVKTGTGHELRGRGLCLVPVSLTSQVYHDDTLPDCWSPAYRSCLYP